MSAKQIIETGIPTLDRLLGGGIPGRQSVVVTGNPGTGKTVLCSQLAFAQAARGNRVVIATVASESQEKLLEELQGFSFYEPERIGNEIYLVSVYGALQRGPKEARELLLKAMRDRGAKLLFIDGMRSLRDLWQNESKLRDFLYEINVGLAQIGAIGLFTTEYDIAKLMEYPEATTVDGIVSLATRNVAGRVVRRAQVVKLRGRHHLTGEHVMHITEDGVDFVPRLEEITNTHEKFEPTEERAAFGLPELDSMLHGGLPRKSATLLVGSTGVGKSLLSLQFAAHGVTDGEPALLVTYTEPVERLVARARRVSIDVASMLESGKLAIEYSSPVNIEADDLVRAILQRVETMGARRVVIDGIGELEAGFLEHARVRPVLSAMLLQLRHAGVTAIFVKEVAKIAGPDIDFSDTPISIAAENIIFMRHVESRGRLARVISVLKMRESGHDPYVRPFQITDAGIEILPPADMGDGVLTGMTRNGRAEGAS